MFARIRIFSDIQDSIRLNEVKIEIVIEKQYVIKLAFRIKLIILHKV